MPGSGFFWCTGPEAVSVVQHRNNKRALSLGLQQGRKDLESDSHPGGTGDAIGFETVLWRRTRYRSTDGEVAAHVDRHLWKWVGPRQAHVHPVPGKCTPDGIGDSLQARWYQTNR